MKQILRHKFVNGLTAKLARFRNDCFGGVFTYFAIVAPVLLGFAGLSVDLGVWYANARLTQTATDSAAIAGALEILRSDSDTTAVTAAAKADAAGNGYIASEVTVNFPPLSGPFAGSGDKVEVIISRPAQSFLSQFVFSGSTTIGARAVGVAALNDTCVWSLNTTESSAIKVSGTSEVNLGCGVLSNSSDATAVTENGTTSCLNATEIKTVGGTSGDCFGATPITGVTPVADPLASLQAPSSYIPGVCDFTSAINVGSSDNVTLTPGTYCGKITVASGGVLDFEPGVYSMDGAGLTFSGTVTGDDVNFYLSENNGTADNISINAGANIDLEAATSGELPGILFYHDRNSPDNVTHSFTGGASMELEGILYFPNQDVKFAGGTSLDSSTSLIIADTVTFTGNTTIGGFEDTPTLINPLLITATLVE